MTLDKDILNEARELRSRLLELQHDADRAKLDYHHAIRRLHAAGGSMREIAEELDLSHQRVHQIVEGPAGPPGGPPWARRRWKHGRQRGRNRRYFMARFDDGARDGIRDRARAGACDDGADGAFAGPCVATVLAGRLVHRRS